jgi:hypothetical protein
MLEPLTFHSFLWTARHRIAVVAGYAFFIQQALFSSAALGWQTPPPQSLNNDRPAVSMSEGRQPGSPDVRLATPSLGEQQAAAARLQEVFGDEINAAKTADAKAGLAERLDRVAATTPQLADRWALLNQAARLAADSGRPEMTDLLTGRIADSFAVDLLTLRVQSLAPLAQAARPESALAVGRLCLQYAHEASSASRIDLAQQASRLGLPLARKAKDPRLIAQYVALGKELGRQQKLGKQLTDILEKLREHPEDTDLSLRAGELLCFELDDWTTGLPLLAKGSDAHLGRVARLTLDNPQTRDKLKATGDAWWDWSERSGGPQGHVGKVKAAEFYVRLAPLTDGLEKAAIEKRIAQTRQLSTKGRIQPIFVADIEGRQVNNAHAFSADGKYGGKAIVCGGQKCTKTLVTMPAQPKSAAAVTIPVPAGASRIRGAVGLFGIEGRPGVTTPQSPIRFEIYADSIRIWQSPLVQDSSALVPFTVSLTGSDRVELRATIDGPNGYCWAAWVDPVIE